MKTYYSFKSTENLKNVANMKYILDLILCVCINIVKEYIPF